jgi:hypothetical protein
MELIITWILIVYGTSLIITTGSIFDQPREWIAKKSKFIGDLVGCMKCTSTWVGFLYSLILWSPSLTLYWLDIQATYLCIFFDGMLACGGAWITNAFVNYLISFTKY